MIDKDYIQIDNERREKLIKLDAGLLAQQYPGVDDAVERLIATNEQNVLRFKNKLTALKRRKEFFVML